MNLNETSLKISTTPIIAMASGKGGAGKTGMTLNLATLLTQQGLKVLVFDGDMGLGNVDVQLGMAPHKDLGHVIAGQATLEEVISKSERGFWVIPGRSGHEQLPFLTALEQRDILKELRNVAGAFDIVIIDVAAGVGKEVLTLVEYADRTLLVTTPDPSSITDAYAVAKLLKVRYNKATCEILVNNAGSEAEGRMTYEKIKTAADKFLGIDLPLVGIVPHDRQYAAAVKMQKIATQAFPNCDAVRALTTIAKKIAPKREKQAA